MDFTHTDKVKALQDKLAAFMAAEIYPNEAGHLHELENGDRWKPSALIEKLKKKARFEGLWNLFLPHSPSGAGLSNLEYAPLCEIMGRAPMASEEATAGSVMAKQERISPASSGFSQRCF